jgi:hypothetical protein
MSISARRPVCATSLGVIGLAPYHSTQRVERGVIRTVGQQLPSGIRHDRGLDWTRIYASDHHSARTNSWSYLLAKTGCRVFQSSTSCSRSPSRSETMETCNRKQPGAA